MTRASGDAGFVVLDQFGHNVKGPFVTRAEAQEWLLRMDREGVRMETRLVFHIEERPLFDAGFDAGFDLQETGGVIAIYVQPASPGVNACIGMEMVGGPKRFLRVWPHSRSTPSTARRGTGGGGCTRRP
jgi:hypothetical protein